MSFGAIVIVSFVVCVLITLTMNAILRYEKVGMEGVYLSAVAWVLGLVLWAVWHRRVQKERRELEEELRQETGSE